MQTKKLNKFTLFTIGPVQMFERTLELRKNPIPYFRNEQFSEMMFGLERKLKNLLQTSDESKIVFLTASGTAAMEASVRNLFDNHDRLLIVNGGTFGQRFCEIAESLDIPYDTLKVDFANDLTAKDFEPFENKNYKGLLVNLDETSCGKLYDIKLLEDFSLRHNSLLVVDAISTFLCEPYEMDKHHIDVTIFSSQKGLCISPGLSFVALSKKAQERLKSNDVGFYTNFKEHLENMVRGQTPFTPAVGILYEADDITDYIFNISLEKWLEIIKDNSDYFRKEIVKRGFLLPSFNKSNAVTMFFVPNHSAKPLKDYLATKGLFINPCGGVLSEDAVRVAHIGNLCRDDYNSLLIEIDSFYNKINKN